MRRRVSAPPESNGAKGYGAQEGRPTSMFQTPRKRISHWRVRVLTFAPSTDSTSVGTRVVLRDDNGRNGATLR